MTTQSAEAYLERLLIRLKQPQAGRYKTGTVANVLGWSREWVRQRTELPIDHRLHIRSVREHTHRVIPHEELVRLIRDESA